jgi:hypothetical protein
MKLRIGDFFGEPAQEFDSRRVCFIAEDGRTMFEVRTGDDGRSIEVRGVDVCKVNGVLYEGRFTVRPMASNAVDIVAVPYAT